MERANLFRDGPESGRYIDRTQVGGTEATLSLVDEVPSQSDVFDLDVWERIGAGRLEPAEKTAPGFVSRLDRPGRPASTSSSESISSPSRYALLVRRGIIPAPTGYLNTNGRRTVRWFSKQCFVSSLARLCVVPLWVPAGRNLRPGLLRALADHGRGDVEMRVKYTFARLRVR